MTNRTPREFWLQMTDVTGVCYYFPESSRDKLIHVREVVDDDPMIIPELINQRSIAFDEAKKWRNLAEEMVEAFKIMQTADVGKELTQQSVQTAVIIALSKELVSKYEQLAKTQK